jgi:hypothetical protein
MIEGFNYIGSCNCTGTKNLKYQKGNYIIYHLPKRKTFHLKEGNTYAYKNQPISTLCEKLKLLGLTELNDCLKSN